jgi:hypothetical protein
LKVDSRKFERQPLNLQSGNGSYIAPPGLYGARERAGRGRQTPAFGPAKLASRRPLHYSCESKIAKTKRRRAAAFHMNRATVKRLLFDTDEAILRTLRGAEEIRVNQGDFVFVLDLAKQVLFFRRAFGAVK